MAGEKGSVICEVLEQTRSNAIRGNQNLRLLFEYGISVLQGATDCLHIYDKNCKRNGTIKLPRSCLCFDIVSSQGFCHVLCGLEDGRIINVNLQQWCLQAKKKKKKRRSKEKKGVPEDQAFEGQEEEQRKPVKQNLEGGDGEVGCGRVDGGGGEEDIFADLLAGEENDDLMLGNGGGGGDGELLANQMQEFYAALGEVTVVDRPHVVLETHNLEGFLVISNTLVTCCREDHEWRISAHQCSVDSTNMSSITCEKTPSYSTVVFSCDELPEIGSFCFKSCIAAQCQHDALGNVAPNENTDYEDEANQTASLYGVISASSSHSNQTAMLHSTNLLVISDALFDSLWGAAANLIDCPVALVTLPDGCVYKIFLKNVSVASGMSQRGQQRVRLLYQSVQPIIQVSSIALNQSEPVKTSSNMVRTSSDCLVLVGASGQVVTLVAEATELQSTKTAVHYVHGPLATAVVVKNKLACAANSEINLLAFHLGHEGAVQVQAQCFHVAGISSLACVKTNSSCLKFLAVKKDGTLLRLTLPTDQTPSMIQSAMTSSAAGQRIKELLHSIQEISSKMASLTEVAKGQTLILQELGKAHHVVCNVEERLSADMKELGKSAYIACPSNEKSGGFQHRTKATEPPNSFELRARVECCHYNGGSGVRVVCEVTNGTQWTLSQGWTLVASLSGNIDQDMDSRCCPYHKTVSIPLVNFVPQSTELFSFVLNEGSQRFVFPLEVQCSLHFDFPSFREHLLGSRKDHPSNETDVTLHDRCQGVVFTVGSRTLDILDALQFPSSASQRHVRQRKPHSDWRTKGLSGRSGVQMTSRKQSSLGFGCSSSISISLDKVLLRTLPEDDKLDPSERLINLLLPSNRLRDVKGHCVEAATPDGCLISIQAADSPVTQNLTLQITASEDRVTRRLAQAIHHRLKSSILVLAPLSLDAEEGQKDMRVIKNQSEALHTIQDQLADQPSKVHLLDTAKGVMGIHSNMRSQLAIH